MKLQISNKEKWLIFENAISWVVVFAMYVYGFGKFIQFGDTSQNHLPVSKLSGMQLMWAFYGYSKPYVLLLGCLEILGGTLLLIRKTRLLGCILISTILINVILQDIFYSVHLGALKAAIVYQSLISIILFLNRENVVASFNKLLIPNINSLKSKTIVHLFLAFVLFIVLRVLEYVFTIYIF